ncbi:MAG: winged helix-turn-helix transcriptional regulator [Acidobacteria bacterium]|nr:winged helix-turn-helix transcriptional regulator [Acidobacteriota bacterium]
MVESFQYAHLEMDFGSKALFLDSGRVRLTRKEYELLALLVENAGEVVPRDLLLRQIWGYGSEIRTRTLDVHIRRLRKKLAAAGARYIETIFGVGYRFQPLDLGRPAPAPDHPALSLKAS